jgi:thymidylate synthase (FAD)
MKLIKTSFEITHITENPLEKIEYAARDCYQSQDRIESGSSKIMVANLIKRGHEAMLEFADMTVRFTCDRGISHELVRMRLCSFSQESQRYVDSKDSGVPYIKPGKIEEDSEAFKILQDSVAYSEEQYNKLRNLGLKPEVARSVLPNCTATHINMKANFREWRHVFKLRTSKVAHSDMRVLMISLLEEAKTKVPILFDDIMY